MQVDTTIPSEVFDAFNYGKPIRKSGITNWILNLQIYEIRVSPFSRTALHAVCSHPKSKAKKAGIKLETHFYKGKLYVKRVR